MPSRNRTRKPRAHKKAAAEEIPPLRVKIFYGKKHVVTTIISDPRARFSITFNKLPSAEGNAVSVRELERPTTQRRKKIH